MGYTWLIWVGCIEVLTDLFVAGGLRGEPPSRHLSGSSTILVSRVMHQTDAATRPEPAAGHDERGSRVEEHLYVWMMDLLTCPSAA